VEEAAARKRAKEEKMKNKPKESETKATERDEAGEPPVPAKAKRTSQKALKVSAAYFFYCQCHILFVKVEAARCNRQ